MFQKSITAVLTFCIVAIIALGFFGLGTMDSSVKHNCSLSMVGNMECPMSISSDLAVVGHHVEKFQEFGQAFFITVIVFGILLVVGILFVLRKQLRQHILFIQQYYLFRIRYFKRKPQHVKHTLLKWLSLHYARIPYAPVQVRCLSYIS